MTPEQLKDWRSATGQTQDQIAEFFGVTRVTLSRWENGHVRIPRHVHAACRWANAITALVRARDMIDRTIDDMTNT